jgi:RNA-directed DNA polymerase
MSHNLDRNVGRESDGGVLPAKCPNKGGSSSPAEGIEGRPLTKENTEQMAASQMQSWGDALAGLRRMREAAKRDKRLRFTALLHHVSEALLSNSFYALKREAAPGVDGLTWQEYETDLDKRLEDLHSRVHQGTYRALPSKRAYILKQHGGAWYRATSTIMLYPGISPASGAFGSKYVGAGCTLSVVAARGAG